MKHCQHLRYLPWALGAVLVVLALGRYVFLSSNIADLGFFINNFHGIAYEWHRAFHGHVQPLMLIWGVGYQELPATIAPIVLLVVQSLLLLGSVIVIWRIFGMWPGIAMLLYYPLWANALFDFHFDHLAVPILVVFFVACEQKRFGIAAIAGASLALVKEPFALQVVACGIYFFWMAWKLRNSGLTGHLLLLGALLIIGGMFWFYGATHWLLRYFGDGSRGALDSHAFSWLGSDILEMMWSIVSRLDRILLEIISTPNKLMYLVVIFGLLAFVPLLQPTALIVALPLLMIAMLSKGQPGYYGYANHYTAGVIVPAIVAFRDGLPVVRKWFDRLFVHRERTFGLLLLAWLIGGHMMFASSPISRLFWSDKVWSYSWRAYVPTEREAMMKAAMLAYIPTNPEASVSTQNTVNWYHLAHRKVYLPFPMGVGEPPHKVIDWSNRDLPGLWTFIRTGEKTPAITHDRYADYVVLDMKRPYFIVDKGCNWIYGKCLDKEVERKFLDWVSYTRTHYDTVFEQDGFMILRRKT